MHFAVEEFERFRAFCEGTKGVKPNAVSIELAKIDLLIMGKHWADTSDIAKLMPALGGIYGAMTAPPGAVALRWQEDVADLNVAVAVSSVRLKADPNVPAFRVEFRASGPVVGDVAEYLVHSNRILNDVFHRLIADPEGRFS